MKNKLHGNDKKRYDYGKGISRRERIINNMKKQIEELESNIEFIEHELVEMRGSLAEIL